MTIQKNILRSLLLLSFCFLVSHQTNSQRYVPANPPNYDLDPFQFNALLVTTTAPYGFRHASIEAGVRAMEKLAEKHHFGLVHRQDGSMITYDYLKDFEVVIFMNTANDAFNEQEQAAFEKFIQSGKGYVGIHAASDTEYDWEWYTQLVGRMFSIHPNIQTAELKVLDHNFPGLKSSPEIIIYTEEWYEFGPEKVEGLNYLLSVDEDTYSIEAASDKYEKGRIGTKMGFHPISWHHEFDGGRSFFTGLGGHLDLQYEDEWFLDHLYGGIYWAATGQGIGKK